MRKAICIIVTGRVVRSACWLACVITASFCSSVSQAEPPEKVTIEQERKLLLGKWVGVTYDMDGKVDQKLGKREVIEMEFSLQKGLPENGVIVFFKTTGIRGLPFSNRAGVGLSRGGIGTIVQQEGLSVATLKGSKYTPPDYIAYKFQGDSLTVMPHLDPEDSAAPSLTTEKGDDRIVFHFQRKKDGKKTKESPPKTEESKQDNQSPQPTLTIESLHGEWEGKTFERNGKKARPFKGKQKSTLTLNERIEAFELVFSKLEQRKMRGSSSHSADFTSSPMRFYRVTGGVEPRKDLIAIFHLKDDSLVWCWVTEQEADGNGTPLELTTRPNDLRTIIHYVRKSNDN